MTRPLLSFRPSLMIGHKRTLNMGLVTSLCGLLILSGCGPKPKETASKPAQDTQAIAPALPSRDQSNTPIAPEKAAQNLEKPAVTAVSTNLEDVSGGKAITIAGGWVNAGGACDSGASVFFNADGTYMSEGENGTWALSGKTLTVTTSTSIDEGGPQSQGPDESPGDSGEKAVLTLLSLTDDTARVVLSNGSNANWTRCTS